MSQPPHDAGHGQLLRDQGIAALNSGDRARARQLLTQATQVNPSDEYAWLWLAAAADNANEEHAYLQRVLAINPTNEAARNRLHTLQASSSPAYQQPAQAAGAGYGPPGTAQPVAYAPAAGYPQPGGYPPYGANAPAGYSVPALYGADLKRPGCISALAILVFAVGSLVVLLALLLASSESGGELAQALARMTGGIVGSAGGGAVMLLALGLLGAVTGVGLWRGSRWGWWLAAVNYGTNVCLAVVSATYLASQFAVGIVSLLSDSLRQIAIPLAILIYLFRPEPWRFFKLEQRSKTSTAALVLGISAAISIALFGLLISAV